MPDSSTSAGDLTRLLSEAAEGSETAREQLWTLVYPDLKRLAHRELQRNRPGRTLQTTALVHDLYLRLFGQEQVELNDRHHFFALAARAMRLILVDFARQKGSEKRGAGKQRVELDEAVVVAEESAQSILAVDESLSRLSATDKRLGKVVECRFFGGMTGQEIAELLGITERTVWRDWRAARAWLAADLADPAT